MSVGFYTRKATAGRQTVPQLCVLRAVTLKHPGPSWARAEAVLLLVSLLFLTGLVVSLSAPRRGQSDCCYCPSSRRPRPRVCLLREEAQDSGILADVFPSLSSPLGPRGWVVFFPVIWSEHSARVTLSDSEVSIWTVTGGPVSAPCLCHQLCHQCWLPPDTGRGASSCHLPLHLVCKENSIVSA